MKKYAYIRAWGKMSGSFPSYIERQVQRAEESNAPETAIYQKDDGTWSTVEDIKREETRREIEAIVKEMEENRHGKVGGRC